MVTDANNITVQIRAILTQNLQLTFLGAAKELIERQRMILNTVMDRSEICEPIVLPTPIRLQNLLVNHSS